MTILPTKITISTLKSLAKKGKLFGVIKAKHDGYTGCKEETINPSELQRSVQDIEHVKSKSSFKVIIKENDNTIKFYNSIYTILFRVAL